MREKRQFYRVLRRPPEVEVALELDTESYVEAELVDVSAGGVGFRVSIGNDPGWEADRPIRLRFRGTGLRRALVLDATVRHMRSDGKRIRYGCRFEECEGLEELNVQINTHFNRRQMIRVRPEQGRRLRVAIRGVVFPSRFVETIALITDISGSGMSIVVDSDAHGRFCTVRDAYMSFRLPTAAEPVRIAGTVVYRVELFHQWRYGVEFSPALTQDFEIERGRIMGYVDFRRGVSITDSAA